MGGILGGKEPAGSDGGIVGDAGGGCVGYETEIIWLQPGHGTVLPNAFSVTFKALPQNGQFILNVIYVLRWSISMLFGA